MTLGMMLLMAAFISVLLAFGFGIWVLYWVALLIVIAFVVCYMLGWIT